MFRLFLLIVGVMAASMSVAGDVSSCTTDTVPIQIMDRGNSGPVTTLSAADLSDTSPHFRAFVTDVTKHINSRLVKDKLCINSAESIDSMDSAESKKLSLLQFVRWHFSVLNGYTVPALPVSGSLHGGCRISSPWIDLTFERTPVSSIRGIIYWNERQLFADQAVLAGVKNVPLSVAMPLKLSEYRHFKDEYVDTELSYPPKPVVKPIEERVPADFLWLFRHSGHNERAGPFRPDIEKAIEKSAEGYTKLVIALVDRCFAANEVRLHYSNILDVGDPILLEQYRIDTPVD
jgi:hypothetical protein